MIKEEMDLTNPLEGCISEEAVEHMADNLAHDEMHSLHFGDIQFVLKALLRDKYKRMTPRRYKNYTKTAFTTSILTLKHYNYHKEN